jgi:proprotein convertase subtilisin/kexin type 5
MQPCPYSCYQCIGPLTTQCRSCVQGWNRVLSAGRCVCISGFYDPGAPTCKNCTEAIAGCKTCSSATNCLTCLSGCTAIGFSPIYCDCPNHVQQNYSYNCQAGFYFDFNLNTCACLPQTYYNSAARLCFPCAVGCYICARNASYCLACIDAYNLVSNACIYFYTSYALLGQTNNYNDPKLRCLRWDQTTGSCTQRCKYYYYEANCYSKCPQGTFNISFPWLTCQPCQHSCQLCFNYTICYQCATTYFYFNSTILSCSPCTSNCVKCSSASACSLC